MDKVVFDKTTSPTYTLLAYRRGIEQVLSSKNIKGVTLKYILQESLPDFSIYSFRIDLHGRIVIDERLYNALEFGTLSLPRFQIISKAKKLMGRRPPWQIHS